MRQDRYVARDHQVEEEILQLRRRRMMRRFNQHVARIGDGQEMAGTKPGNEIGGHVNVRAGGQAKRNSLLIEKFLESLGCLPNGRAGIMIKPG